MPSHLRRAGQWFARSGIQETGGGVARYYRADLTRNQPVSTEITGYAASSYIYLFKVTGDQEYLDLGRRTAEFLTRTAWRPDLDAIPFELGTPVFTYFFDCGMIVRGLLAVWRATGEPEFLDSAENVARTMKRFAHEHGLFEPILSLPEWLPTERDPARWSRNPGCYQLKAAAAWVQLAELTGDAAWSATYDESLEHALNDAETFLPGDADPMKVMDRLHPFLYFLEGLLPHAHQARCAAAIRSGIGRVAHLYRQIAPDFARCDVLAQLLRIRIYADRLAIEPLDSEAVRNEAEELACLQAACGDARACGGFYFGRRAGQWVPHVSPVSTAFAMQALEMWRGGAAAVDDLI